MALSNGISDVSRSAPSDGSAVLIAEARQAAGLTQKALADRIGVSLWTIDQIERADRDATPHLEAIAVATGRSSDSLGTRKGAVPRPPANGQPPDSDEPSDGEVGGEAEATRADETPRGKNWVRNIVFGSVAALVLIRFFAEDLGVVPRGAKLVDIPIFLSLLFLAVVAPRRLRDSTGEDTRYVLAPLLFFLVFTASLLVNSGRIEIAPAFLFLYGFLSPVAIFHAVRQLWPAGQGLAASRLFVGLACVEFAVVLLIDLPEYLKTRNPDLVSGTFGENAYQLVFFLLMCAALVAGILTVERRRLVARLAPLFFAAVAGTVLLAQYRAILLTAALTVLLVTIVLGLVRVRGALAGALVAVAFVVGVSLIPSLFPELKLEKTVSTLSGDPGSYISARLDAGSDVADLYSEKPHTIVLGAGPGTFSSRAWETFALTSVGSPSSLGVDLPFGVGPGGTYTTDVSEKYTTPRVKNREVVEGSYALTTPFASYYALLAEVGILGFVLLVALYGRALVDSVRMTLTALRRAPDGDPLPGLLLASTAGFFVIIQMAILSNWWEVTRITFILWTLFAIATKEYETRYGTRRPGPRLTT